MGKWTRRWWCVYALLGILCAVIETQVYAADADASPRASRNERGALKMLYWATDGPAWSTGWDIQNERSDPCEQRWYGIACDDRGHIVSLRLPRNNLVGYVPAEFPREALRFLQELDLSSNFLTGSVPPTISRLSQLRVLRLDRNWFTGPLPASIGSLAFLEYLEVQGNLFSVGANGRVIPDQVAVLSQTSQCHIII